MRCHKTEDNVQVEPGISAIRQALLSCLTPQVAALFAIHRQETSTGSGGKQEQREPKVDAARQLKQVAPAQDSAPMDNDTRTDRGFMHGILARSQTPLDVIAPDFSLEFAGFFPQEKSRKTRKKSGAFRENSG